jgi:hypothetical protein
MRQTRPVPPAPVYVQMLRRRIRHGEPCAQILSRPVVAPGTTGSLQPHGQN